MDERSIFLEAIEKSSAEERAAYINEACGHDVALREKVKSLLSAHEDAGSFLEKLPEEFVETAGAETGPPDATNDAWMELLEPSETAGSLGSIGPYDVIELIGRGGMGIVLRAHDPKLKRTVAIKLLSPELAASPTSVMRFLREAQAAAAVSHDHVVTIHAINESARPPMIVMEYVDGCSLQQKIDRSGPLDLKSILRIGMQTAAGLAAAHRQGLVHRDIKPSNILLENGVERVKLSDFGLARAVDDVGVTRTGQITGTPQYMSPEQAQGQRVDHRTDLFSLGCVLYAMCTGQSAFRANSAVAVMHSVIHDTPKPINVVNPEMPDWLCEIVDKLMEKNPDDRFQFSDKVEDLLARHLAHLQQPESLPQPERVGHSRSVGAVQPLREETLPLAAAASPQRRATDILVVIGALDVIACLALFSGIAPGFHGRDIPGLLAVTTVLGGLAGIALFVTTLYSRRQQENGALPRPLGIRCGILALLPCGPVHVLVIPVSIWIVHVFWHRAPAGPARDASANPADLPTQSTAKWPALYVTLMAVALVILAQAGESGLVKRTWLNLAGRGTIAIKLHNAEVRVTLNGTPQAVDKNGNVEVSVRAGVYVIRSTVAIYVQHIRRGTSLTQEINKKATDVAIIGPVSTEMPDEKSRIELLKKYSQIEPSETGPRVE